MAKSLLRGSAALAVADFSKKALLGVTVLLCARSVPKVVFGEYMFLMTFYQIFFVIAGSGVPNILIRDIARHSKWMPDHAVASMTVRLVYAIPAITLMVSFFLFGRYSHTMLLPLFSLGMLVVLRSMTENAMAIFQGREDVTSCAAISLVQSSVTLVSTAVVCFTTKSFVQLVLCHSLGAACSALYALFRFHKRRLPLRSGIRGSSSIAMQFFYDTAWNNGATLVSSAYNRCDVLLLQHFSSAEAVATYSAPYRLLDLAQIIPTSVMGMMLPRISRVGVNNSAALDQDQLLSLLLIAALVLITMSSLLAPWIIPFLLGAQYGNSVPVAQVLIWATPFMFSNYFINTNLIAARLERFVFLSSSAALVFNLAANTLLIPRIGYMGAAFVTVLTEFVLLTVNLWFCRRSALSVRPAWTWRIAVSYTTSFAAALLWAAPTESTRPFAFLFFFVSIFPVVPPVLRLLKTSGNLAPAM